MTKLEATGLALTSSGAPSKTPSRLWLRRPEGSNGVLLAGVRLATAPPMTHVRRFRATSRASTDAIGVSFGALLLALWPPSHVEPPGVKLSKGDLRLETGEARFVSSESFKLGSCR